MRQKYLISRNDTKSELKISEFAITDQEFRKNAAISNIEMAGFTFLCTETYTRDKIQNSISKGIETLVGCLRTRNIFPISPYANKIAESVIALYSVPEDGSVELFFDDLDLMASETRASDESQPAQGPGG